MQSENATEPQVRARVKVQKLWNLTATHIGSPPVLKMLMHRLSQCGEQLPPSAARVPPSLAPLKKRIDGAMESAQRPLVESVSDEASGCNHVSILPHIPPLQIHLARLRAAELEAERQRQMKLLWRRAVNAASRAVKAAAAARGGVIAAHHPATSAEAEGEGEAWHAKLPKVQPGKSAAELINDARRERARALKAGGPFTAIVRNAARDSATGKASRRGKRRDWADRRELSAAGRRRPRGSGGFA